MKKISKFLSITLIMVVLSSITTGISEDNWNWHDDDRVWSEYYEDEFSSYGIDEWIHIGDELIIHIHYNPDLSGGWYEYPFYKDGKEVFKVRSDNISMRKLGKEIDIIGAFTVAKMDLENEP